MQSNARAWRGYGAALAVCFLFPWAGTSHAASTTTTFAVSATIVATCTINSASTLNFGNSIGVLAANVDQQSTIQVTCTNTTPYTIALDAGTGSGATVAVRKLTSGGATINYSLYTSNTYGTAWGVTGGTDTVAGTGNGSAQSYTVYGRIPPQTTPAPGTYTDTITVTVGY
jgi:spore coat protein U-like protein